MILGGVVVGEAQNEDLVKTSKSRERVTRMIGLNIGMAGVDLLVIGDESSGRNKYNVDEPSGHGESGAYYDIVRNSL